MKLTNEDLEEIRMLLIQHIDELKDEISSIDSIDNFTFESRFDKVDKNLKDLNSKVEGLILLIKSKNL